VDALSAAIEEIAGVTPALSTTGGTSDGRFIADIAAQVVEFGPINASIHKIDENVGVMELEQLAQVYRHTLEKLLHA
jgi:succinyl-diaminopimelate desuccinylase